MTDRFYGRALGDYPYTWVQIDCRQCRRYGCYRLTGLVERFGCRITLFDLLDRLVVDCWRWNWKPGDPGEPCAVDFIDHPFQDGAPPTVRSNRLT